MGVANLTELANSQTLGNLLSSTSSPAFVKGTCMMNLMMLENLPTGTAVKKFTKNGSLTAAIVAESTAAQPDANGELTDTSVTATAAKTVVSSGITVEEQRFGNIDIERIGNEQFAAIARAVDTDALVMASGFSTAVTAASVLTVDDLFTAQFNIFNSNCPNQEVPLAAVIGPRAGYNLKKEVFQSGASAWSNPALLGIFNDQPVQANCYIGRLLANIDIYQTTGFGTTGGDDRQMVIHPMWALAGMFDTAPQTWILQQGAAGLYTEVVSYLLYDIIELNDLAGNELRSDT